MTNKEFAWKSALFLISDIGVLWGMQAHENHIFHEGTAIGEGWPTISTAGSIVVDWLQGETPGTVQVHVTDVDSGECESVEWPTVSSVYDSQKAREALQGWIIGAMETVQE